MLTLILSAKLTHRVSSLSPLTKPTIQVRSPGGLSKSPRQVRLFKYARQVGLFESAHQVTPPERLIKVSL
jgi:hypothetical protein